MKKHIYTLSIILTAIFLFWPVMYTEISKWVTLPGNPLIQSVVGVLVFGTVAYMSFEEETEENQTTAS
ncbi:MAG: hypothetical protein J7L37_10010 [Thermococcus sp.]|nr:hypothetical protein [Thermococcus sp.]